MAKANGQGGKTCGPHSRIPCLIFLSCLLLVVPQYEVIKLGFHDDIRSIALDSIDQPQKPGALGVGIIQDVGSIDQSHNSANRKKQTSTSGTDKEAFSKLQLFVPGFPGGFPEMKSTFIRSLEFFWPRDSLDILLILDESVYHNSEDEKQAMTAQVKSMFRAKDLKNTEVAYNPRCEMSLFSKGWNIQQLIMLWADNFTTSEFIGFLDDDTLFSKAIIPYDVFDSQGRPRAIVKYSNGIHDMEPHYKQWYRQYDYMFGQPAYLNAMSYFPVVIRREHLPEIRQAMLDQHPEFASFDDLFISFVRRRKYFSQFQFMFDYLWRTHREEYSWHFEADRLVNLNNVSGFVKDDPIAKMVAIKDGSPQENGVTAEMLKPFPRCAVHGNYDHISGISQIDRAAQVTEYMRRGFCFSLPQKDGSTSNPDEASCCRVYNVSNEINKSNEWIFEGNKEGELWPFYDYPGVVRAHEERMRRNVAHKWDSDELSTIFGDDSCGKVEGLF
jgi:hypothetical protein